MCKLYNKYNENVSEKIIVDLLDTVRYSRLPFIL